MIPVYLVQPNYHALIHGRYNYWLPYSVGIIWSYAAQDPVINEQYVLARILYKRDNVDKTAENVVNGSVVAFSCYIWNWEYNLALAKKIKELAPKCLIVFGGPQVSNRPLETGFFKKYPFVDSIILAEGEQSFTDCLKDHLVGKRKRIYQAARLENLDIPSPYLTGLFDSIIEDNPDVVWSTTLETNRGCPFQCTFCDWGSLTYSKIKKFDKDRVFQEIEWIGRNQIDYVTVADANFGIFKERDYQIAKKICEVKTQYGFPTDMSITFTKNSNSHVVDILQLFNKSKLSRGLTLSFQSMDTTVLANIKRANMDINDAKGIFQLLDKNHLAHYSELILGLPSETFESWNNGLIKLIELGQHQCIDVFHAMLLENSEMNMPNYKEKFNITSVKVNNIMASVFEGDVCVAEHMKIVRSTNTMSPVELVEAYMFSWVIINFHCYGWSQVYSRFLNGSDIISYFEFYNLLWENVAKGNAGKLSEWYAKYKNHLIEYLDNNENFVKEHNIDILREAQRHFHLNRGVINDFLFSFVSHLISPTDNDLMQSLFFYQDHFVASPFREYPYTIDVDIGIQDTIISSKTYTKKIKSCTIKLTDTFKTKEDFLTNLSIRRRNGWGKTIISENYDNG